MSVTIAVTIKLIFITAILVSTQIDIYIELYTLTYYVIQSPGQWSSIRAAGCGFIWTDPVLIFTSLIWRHDPADVVISTSHTLAWWQRRGSNPTPLANKARMLTTTPTETDTQWYTQQFLALSVWLTKYCEIVQAEFNVDTVFLKQCFCWHLIECLHLKCLLYYFIMHYMMYLKWFPLYLFLIKN